MKRFLLMTILLTTLGIEISLADISLQEQNENQDELNPVNEGESEETTNKHDKRTIFGPHKNVGWVKHVIVKNGYKKLLGYSPIDYKFAAIPRPIVIKPPSTGYYYPKPVKSPPVIDNSGWKPIVTKPAGTGHVDIVQRPHIDVVQQKPHIDVIHQPHLDVVHNKPFPHVDQVNLPPHIHQAPLDGHLHLQLAPGHIGHVHLQPTGHIDVLQSPAPHVHQTSLPAHLHYDLIHQDNVVHNEHIDTLTHVDHVHPHAHLLRVPAHSVFEVTKPNLGVLPLGARFSTPVLREAPHFHLRPVIPIPQPVIPVHPPVVPATPVVPQHVLSAPHVYQTISQPLPLIEYHKAVNHHSHQHLPVEEQNFLQQQLPSYVPLPTQHAQPEVLIEHHENLGHRIVNHHPHQHLPVEEQNFLQQPLPSHLQLANQQGLWEQIPAQAAHLNIPQQALPLEGEQQHLSQPGQTDLQIPFHLPNHPGWDPSGNVVKPSMSLEPPYKR